MILRCILSTTGRELPALLFEVITEHGGRCVVTVKAIAEASFCCRY